MLFVRALVLAVLTAAGFLGCAGETTGAARVPTPKEGVSAAAPPSVAAPPPSGPRESSNGPPTTTPPVRKCDALAFVSPASVNGTEKPYVEAPGGAVEGNGDLDGDGVPEIAVVYNETARTMGTTILKKHQNGECFTSVYAGRGQIFRVLATKTNGWADLELTVAGRDPAKGFTFGGATVVATFDGARYVWSRNLGCKYMEGSLPAKLCEELVKKANPAGTVVPTK